MELEQVKTNLSVGSDQWPVDTHGRHLTVPGSFIGIIVKKKLGVQMKSETGWTSCWIGLRAGSLEEEWKYKHLPLLFGHWVNQQWKDGDFC